MDFGEHLVVVREELEVPLPIRVPFWHLFAVAALESYSMTMIYLLRRNWRSSAQDQYGLTPPDHDLHVVMEQFRQLNGRLATRQQIEQAEQAFHEQMQRRYERINREIDLWLTAMRRGLFIGTLLMGLLLTTLAMCLFSDRIFAFQMILVVLLTSQLFGAFVCIQGWHRP